MVKVVIKKGKYQGVYIGRAVVKSSGYCDVATSSGKKISTSWKRFRLLQRFDGYPYDCRHNVKCSTKIKSRRPSRSIRSDDLPDGIGGIVILVLRGEGDGHTVLSKPTRSVQTDSLLVMER